MSDETKPTMIRARIRVAVWPDGRWTAYGDEGRHIERTHRELIEAAPDGESYHWIEADLPMPAVVQGKVVE